MIVVTTPDVPGMRIVSTLGLVRGNTIRARHIGRDISDERHLLFVPPLTKV